MKEANRAHMLLDYIITRAVSTQELMDSEIVLDYQSLCTEVEDVLALPEQANNIRLKIKILTSWDLSEETAPSYEELYAEEEGDEDEYGEEATSDSDKKSH